MKFKIRFYRDSHKENPSLKETHLVFLKGESFVEDYVKSLTDSQGNKFQSTPEHERFDFISKSNEAIEVVIE